LGKIKTKAPGKLYVAGEYAVVEPGYSAIITAVDLFIHLTIAEAEGEFGSIYSEGFTDEPMPWKRVKEKVELKQTSPALKYVLAAIYTTENYLADFGYSFRNYHLQITSDLENETGSKLGLGSSGAVTVATVRGLLQFYEMAYSDELVYKLSVLAQLQLGINSSFGDLAAITYTGWIEYTSFDREQVLSNFNLHSVKETVEMNWPYLKIQRLKIPKTTNFLIGWTGSPASSDHLVGAVQQRKTQSMAQYKHFLNESKKAVQSLSTALLANNQQHIIHAVNKNRKALLQMGQETNVMIETPKLTQLIEIAKSHAGVAKTSGAGGGDSGIAFIFEEELVDLVVAEWTEAGITNLPLSIYTKEKHN
jgi:phosphomevalonate kinase